MFTPAGDRRFYGRKIPLRATLLDSVGQPAYFGKLRAGFVARRLSLVFLPLTYVRGSVTRAINCGAKYSVDSREFCGHGCDIQLKNQN